ncbi:MAG: hypothetical protein KDA96_19995 [Planctomycetaceae bacterium]|nr:hypothetical protein [Planctomycetaceae bacterium]
MYTIQRLSLCDENERVLSLRGDRQYIIGAGSAAAMRLHQSFGLPAACLRVWLEESDCIARNETGDPYLVLLNGQPLVDLVKLEDGDALQIGSDQFVFLLERDDPKTAAAAQPTVAPLPVPVEPEIDYEIQSQPLNAAVSRYEPRDSRWKFEVLLRQLCLSGTVIQFVNFRHAGVPTPNRKWIGDDLFAEAPDDVRDIYSLHAITGVELRDHLELHQLLTDRDAEVWAIPASDAESCLREAKLHLAWLARPSVLEMTLRRSPKDFCASLLQPFSALVVAQSRHSSAWTILSDAEFQLPG